jgi:hypothetical protein
MKNNILKEQMLSLYDYLGKAAGPILGKEVHKIAYNKKIPFAIKEISNPKYTGKILMYPKYFLDEYFGVDNKKNDNDNNLPF